MSSSRVGWRRVAAAIASSRPHTTIRRHLVSGSQILLASQANEQSYSSQQNNKTLVALALLTAGTFAFSSSSQTDCCGIAGVVGAPNHDARYSIYYVVWFMQILEIQTLTFRFVNHVENFYSRV